MPIHELARVPRIVAGIGARARLPALVADIAGAGASVLLVADPGLKASGMADEVAAFLTGAGHPLAIFDDFASDPSLAATDKAAALARAHKAALVVALGGGSAIDLGKAVASIAGAARSAGAYQLCKRPFPKKRLPSICLPTTSGTGAETTRTSVLSRADKTKVWLWGENNKTDAVVLDPELTVSLPAFFTAATGIDALVHAVEAATNRNAHAANNLFAYEAIRLATLHLETAVAHPADLAARAGMQRAAALAGIAIDNTGTSIAHSIGHAMASLRPMHHGHAVGVAMLATLPWNVEHDDGAFAACALAMGGKADAGEFVRRFDRLIRAVGLQLSVGEKFSGVSAEALAHRMMEPENVPMLNANRRAPAAEERIALARRVLEMA